MTNAFPDYYAEFRCLADRCAHTCCAGWEIDIDEETMTKYRALGGSLGERVRAAVSEAPTPHFHLETGDVCPFLRSDGLCELILTEGEALLCQICRDHPRFRSFLPEYTETGLGMCCEAAAALILSRRTPPRMLPDGPGPTEPEAAALLAVRDRLIDLAFDRRQSLHERIDTILSACRICLPVRTRAGWASFYLGLERLDEHWTDRLEELRLHGDEVDIIQFLGCLGERRAEYEQILGYFLLRHIPQAWEDGDLGSKVSFAALSTRILIILGALQRERTGRFSAADQAELCRQYSAEIEYSEENLDTLYAELSANGET